MSATSRGAVRAERDFYATPQWCVRTLLRQFTPVAPAPGLRWLDPCAGNGDIMLAYNSLLLPEAQWYLQDIAPVPHYLQAIRYQQDALAQNTISFWEREKPDVLITNPPYLLAEEFVRGYRQTAHVQAYLLRLNFLGSRKRAAWLPQDMPNVYVLPRRPSFSADGKTDACEYAWFIWQRGMSRNNGCVKVMKIEDCV